MTIQFTGLGSGMDYSSWIDALVQVKQVSLNNIQTKINKTEVAQNAINKLKTEVSGLNSCITKFTDSNILSAFDIFGRRKVSSSDEGKTASATVSNDATIQSFSLEVLQLATSTVTTGTKGVGKLAHIGENTPVSEATKLKDIYNGVITNGNITLSINGNTEGNSFEVTDDTTIGDFKNFLQNTIGNAINGTVEFNDGQFTLNATKAVYSPTDPFVQVISNPEGDSNLFDVIGMEISETQENGSNSKNVSLTLSSDMISLDNSSKLKDLNNSVISEGEISIYVNNEKKVFNVDDNTTLNDFKDFLLSEGKYVNSGAGLASVNLSPDGSFSFSANSGQTVLIGSTSDTSNLLDFFGFKNSTENPETYSSDKILTEIQTTGKIMSTGNLSEQVTASKFKIGTEEFTVDENTSISGLMYQINSNTNSGVTASYDAVSNRLILTAKEPGATTINIEAIEGNFTDVVGWTDGSTLAEGSQVLGLNSKFKINDKEFIAASNAISEDVTGIPGLTLSLNKVSEEAVQINIANDYTEIESAITKFIDKYNTLLNDIKSASSKDGDLAYDSSLRRMETELSNTVMNIVPGLTTYSALSSVGISTGSSTTDVSNVSLALVFDKTKFEEAMSKNPNEVKQLFVNLDESNRSNNGVMSKLKDIIEGYTDINGERVPGYLDIENGYFAIKTNSNNKQIETLNNSLSSKQLLIEQYRARLEKQFQNMDNYVSQMSSYSNYLSSIGSK